MNLLILTLGSRGDVQPYLALGQGLKRAGHTVTVCASASFESFVVEHGLNYGYLNDDLMQLMNSEEFRGALENMANLFGAVRTVGKLWKQIEPMQRRMLADSWASAQAAKPDLILFHPKAYGAPHIAEKLGIPAVMGLLYPILVPTAEFPCFGFPNWKLGGWYNRLSYRLVLKLNNLFSGKYVKRWRREQGLPRQPRGTDALHTTTGKPIPVLHGYSKHVIPTATDWPASSIASGYWFLQRPTEWQPSPDLEAFLAAGEAPVYVGFGSMAARDPARVTRVVVEALERAGVRGLIATGWGGLSADELPPSIFRIDSAPHDWLFPRTAAVVHHGGAGTTAAGLRAGRPTIICPFFGDQPSWGRRVGALGVGSQPIPQKKLTVEKLTAAIRDVTTNPAMRQRAEQLGRLIRREDGVGEAVAFIESLQVARASA